MNGFAAPAIEAKDAVCLSDGVFTGDVVELATTGTFALFDVVEVQGSGQGIFGVLMQEDC